MTTRRGVLDWQASSKGRKYLSASSLASSSGRTEEEEREVVSPSPPSPCSPPTRAWIVEDMIVNSYL